MATNGLCPCHCRAELRRPAFLFGVLGCLLSPPFSVSRGVDEVASHHGRTRYFRLQRVSCETVLAKHGDPRMGIRGHHPPPRVLHLLHAMHREYYGLCTYGDRVAREQYFVAAQAELTCAEKYMGSARITDDLCSMFPGINRIFETMHCIRTRLSHHMIPPRNAQ